jgi:hypothetical protein
VQRCQALLGPHGREAILVSPLLQAVQAEAPLQPSYFSVARGASSDLPALKET